MMQQPTISTASNHLCEITSMIPLLSLGQLREGRPGNGVTSELGEEVELDTRVRRLVKARRRHTSIQLDGPRARDLDVHTLGICLCAIRLPACVQCDDFVTQDVVAWCEVGDGQVPGEIVLHQVIGHPCAGVVAALPCTFLDLGP